MTAVAEHPPAVAAKHQPLPQDLNAEMCVLGAMLISPDAAAEIADILDPTDFLRPAHARVFEAILEMTDGSMPIDPIAVADHLTSGKKLVNVDAAALLHSCIEMTPTAANGTWYAQIVKKHSAARKLIGLGVRITQTGYGPIGDIVDVYDRVQQMTHETTTGVVAADPWTALGRLLQPTLDEIEAIGAAGGGLRGLPTGFVDLDRMLQGLQGGQLILIAGRPGQGKTTLAMDILRNLGRLKFPSAMFSLEMSDLELTMRILSAESRVPLHVLRSGQLSDEDWTRLARTMGKLEDLQLYVVAAGGLTLAQLRSQARRMKQKHGIKTLVVDYLQLMTPSMSTSDRRQQVDEISRGLKKLAMELEIPVIAVSQLNRGPESRQDKRPQLSDLRESGGLEQDADIVIMVHRDDYYDKESPRAGEADFIVVKHRNGPTDTISVAAQLHVCRFVDLATG